MKPFNISDVKITELKDSRYVIPFQMHYKENGISKSWDLIKAHESVVIIIYNVTRNVLVCVKQFRPAVYWNSIPPEERTNIDTDKYPAELGVTLEFCAGIVDKDKSLDEIAKEEVLEECGYEIKTEDLFRLVTFRQGVGVNGGLQTLYYTEVTDDMKVAPGGGAANELEYIRVVELTIEDAIKYLDHENFVNSPGGFLYGLFWFRENKADKYLKC